MTGPARQPTMHDLLARQLAGLRTQIDAVLMTMGLMQQQSEAAPERPVPNTFGLAASPEDAAEAERRIRAADPAKRT